MYRNNLNKYRLYKFLYISNEKLKLLYFKLLAFSFGVLLLIWYLLIPDSLLNQANKLQPLIVENKFSSLFNENIHELLRTKGDILQRVQSLRFKISSASKFLKQNWIPELYQNYFDESNLTIITNFDQKFIDVLNQLECCNSTADVVLSWVRELEDNLEDDNYFPLIDLTELYIDDDIFCSKYKYSQCPTYNYLISRFYPFSGSSVLCDAMKRYELLYPEYNNVCEDDIKHAMKPVQLLSNARRYVLKLASRNGYADIDTRPVHPVRIFTKSIITSNGEVFSGNVYVRREVCEHDRNIQNSEILQHYSEVFVISDFGRRNYFSKMIETYPRLSLFIDFLKEHPDIKLHTDETSALLNDTLGIMNISPERIITGTVTSMITYVPRFTRCGYASLLETQVLNRFYRSYALANVFSSYSQKQDTVLIIDSDKTNSFANINEVKHNLEKIAAEFKLKVSIFKKHSATNQKAKLEIFSSVLVVVSTHTSSLANLIFAQTGVLVIESMCGFKDIDFRYHRLANVLGMLWYGLPSTKPCEDGVVVDLLLLADVLPNLKGVV
ncbi:hypothetical protein HELRODRAFT_175370 [Helobdella robusta]|uniref:Uncharacterized protein n=1 Tax=Helobdella robusta TaxID=6412 RepID=T1F972_HELRO|nr:hypothetical protein HELRODRAFT_175370 [Helobdella robusta]ESO00873.1 hypothetical protein HELRODRAFT_175370 [Helobdella robusta]